jgi:SH3-like domain-containing protein
VFNEGDTLGPKIAGVKMYATPSETGKVVATLGRADEMVVVGEEKDGYIQVETGSGKGWVRMTLVQKR